MNRRRFVNLFLGGSLLGTTVSFLYPLIRYLIPPRQAEAAAKKVLAAKAGELAPNSAKLFRFGSSPALLINTADGELRAFSAICTHLTCTVNYEGDTGTIYCPCHNGRFDLAGNVLSGPPPRPLDAYEVEVSGGDIYVSRKD
ncbi:MAG TPA: Rieske (2Fe-2S) protein [Candidatus Desulfaltia sp.]|nr:Rieske (2Fe-2S) protein [Candidatus Desulfaltia sp.]